MRECELNKLVLLITVQRSGSTYLFDLLLSNPKVIFLRNAHFYEMLKLSGNRYPWDLTKSEGNGWEFEIRRKYTFHDMSSYLSPKEYRKVINDSIGNSKNRYRIKPKSIHHRLSGYCANIDLNYYCLEKVHPEFFGFRPKNLLKQIGKLEEIGYKIKPVYLVRDPQAAISSHLNYQIRNPRWYCDINGRRLLEYYFSSYKNILYLMSELDGILVDYKDIIEDPKSVLLDVYKYLWGDEGSGDYENLAGRSVVENMREKKRNVSSSKFLGKTAGKISGMDKIHTEYFDENRRSVKFCTDTYRSIIEQHLARSDKK